MKRLVWLLTALLLAPAAWAEPPALPAASETNPEEAMPIPVRITARGAELGALLEGAGWVRKGTGRVPVYAVGFRSCPDCIAQKMEAGEALETAGADLRFIVYARGDGENGKPRSKPGERAMVAELWKYRDYNLYRAWYATDPDSYYATEDLPPSADSDPQRMAYVEKSRAFVEALSGILRDNGVELYVPALFWRENGVWMVYVGYNPATFKDLVVSRFARL